MTCPRSHSKPVLLWPLQLSNEECLNSLFIRRSGEVILFHEYLSLQVAIANGMQRFFTRQLFFKQNIFIFEKKIKKISLIFKSRKHTKSIFFYFLNKGVRFLKFISQWKSNKKETNKKSHQKQFQDSTCSCERSNKKNSSIFRAQLFLRILYLQYIFKKKKTPDPSSKLQTEQDKYEAY